MRISNAAAYALTAAIALTILAGCSGASPVAPAALAQPGTASQVVQQRVIQTSRLNGFLAMPRGIVPDHHMTTPSFMDPRAVGKPLVFVSYGGTINVYLQGGKDRLVGQIVGPTGYDLATDTAGDLYSANVYSSGSTVTIYAPPYTNGPKLTITGRTSYPIAVSRQRTVAVGGCTNPSGSQCSLGFLFYAAGSSAPCAVVPIDPLAFPSGIGVGAAFDRKGNLYFASAGSGSDAPLAVGKINGGCNAKKARTFTTSNSIAYAGAIRVDEADRLAIFTASSDFNTVLIDTYDAPKGRSLGSPVSTTPLPGSGYSYSGEFAFRAPDAGFWAGNDGLGSSSAGGASEYAYPAGGPPQKTIVGPPASPTYAVAVTPALIP